MSSNKPKSQETLENRILEKLISVLGKGSHGLSTPIFRGNEEKYLLDCVRSTFVSSVGEFVNKFELEIAGYVGAKRAVAVVNGTAGLQIALQLSGVNQGDEVITPAMTFVATANAVNYVGATGHFVDVSEHTLGIDPDALESWLKYIVEPVGSGSINRNTGKRLAAIVPMHTFGHPCEIDKLMAIAHDYGLVVVEDAAEALGSYFQSQHVGTFGKFGVLSFNGNKVITTGGGGAIITNDEQLADRAKHLTTTAKLPHAWDLVHDEVGYNYRMPNINAALGCAQLEQLDEFLKSKRELKKTYSEAFESFSDVALFDEPKNCKSNFWLQTLMLSKEVQASRDLILDLTNAVGIETRPAWELIPNLVPYRSCPSAPLPVANSLQRRIVNIPSSVGIV